VNGPERDGQIPNFRGVRVHVSTGYHRVEGNRRASRNGLVSDLPPEITNVSIGNFCIAVCRPVLEGARPLKLGYALSGDLSKLAKNFQQHSCFQQVNGVVELSSLQKGDVLARMMGLQGVRCVH
jgi:hypothetical protein